jgi:hypothetical protein
VHSAKQPVFEDGCATTRRNVIVLSCGVPIGLHAELWLAAMLTCRCADDCNPLQPSAHVQLSFTSRGCDTCNKEACYALCPPLKTLRLAQQLQEQTTKEGEWWQGWCCGPSITTAA